MLSYEKHTSPAKRIDQCEQNSRIGGQLRLHHIQLNIYKSATCIIVHFNRTPPSPSAMCTVLHPTCEPISKALSGVVAEAEAFAVFRAAWYRICASSRVMNPHSGKSEQTYQLRSEKGRGIEDIRMSNVLPEEGIWNGSHVPQHFGRKTRVYIHSRKRRRNIITRTKAITGNRKSVYSFHFDSKPKLPER